MLRRLLVPGSSLRTPALARSISSSTALFQEQKKSIDATPSTVTELEKTEQVQEFETLSGAPADLTNNRLVRIYQESKPATQSGTWGSNIWRIDWDIVPRANRWENDLMGWASSGDYM